MFVSCHPVLSKEARIALTLRVVGGLSSEEIATAFLVPVPTIQARVTRAKKTLTAAQVPFGVPEPHERAERLGSVLQVIYLIFTEGSFASGGDEWIRTSLAREACRLARVLARLTPDPEAFWLLALLDSPRRDFRRGSTRLASRCCSRPRTDGCGIRQRSGADARPSRGPRGSDGGWVRTVCRRPSPNVTRWRTRLQTRTGRGSSSCTKPLGG